MSTTGNAAKLLAIWLALTVQQVAAVGQPQQGQDLPAAQPRREPSPDLVTVAIADSLAADRTAIEAVLRENPHVQIIPAKSEAELLIAPYPDFPNMLILLDKPPYQRPGDDQRSDAAIVLKFEAIRAGIQRMPPLAGSLDDGSFESGFHTEIGNVLRTRRLATRSRLGGKDGVVTSYFGENARRCSVTAQGETTCETNLFLAVQNTGASTRYVALVQINPNNELVKLKTADVQEQFPLQAGAAVTLKRSDVSFDEMLDYSYFTIASSEPIDLALLDTSSGKEFEIPESWDVSLTKVAGKPGYAGGGGLPSPPMTAPWQVQLYSTKNEVPGSLQSLESLLKPGEAPWKLYEVTHRCGGTLIATNIVLTAAHCVAGEPFAGPEERQTVFKYRRVRLGTQDLTRHGTTYAIDSVVVHFNYRPGRKYNDIALIRIKPDSSTSAVKAQSARTVALAARAPGPNAPVSWYGWGVTEEADSANTRITTSNRVQRNPALLRTGDMQVLDLESCKARPGYNIVTDFMLCAVTPENSDAARQGRHVFTCLGDSGGPIMSKETGRIVQVGVVSWANGCGVNDNPSVSASVARYRGWIRTAMTKFEPGKSTEN